MPNLLINYTLYSYYTACEVIFNTYSIGRLHRSHYIEHQYKIHKIINSKLHFVIQIKLLEQVRTRNYIDSEYYTYFWADFWASSFQTLQTTLQEIANISTFYVGTIS